MKNTNKDVQKNREISKEVEEILELNEIFYSISKMIIEYRRENNITQSKLANMLDVNQTMISKIESGKYNPTVKQIYKISRKLTGKADMFKDTLREILRNLEDEEYVISAYLRQDNNIGNEYIYTNSYENLEENRNIIYIKEYYNNVRGEKINGRYENKYTISG